MSRKMADCRLQPSVSGCSLVIAGEEEEVVRAGTEHAISVHGHTDSPELRRMVRESLQDEPAGFGLVPGRGAPATPGAEARH